MSVFSCRAALQQYLASNWTACPIVWPNVTEIPPTRLTDSNPIWVAAEFMELGQSSTGFGSVGKRFSEHSGVFNGHVLTAVGTTEDTTWQTADALGELLRMLSLGTLHFLSPRTMPIGKQSTNQGAWYGITVTVPWDIYQIV